jgi:hypothetical protein
MLQYVILAEGNKHNRRSVADAIDLLITYAGFKPGQLATICTQPLPLNTGEPLVQLCVQFQSPVKSVTFVVWLPTSVRFKTKSLHQSATKLSTDELNDATVDFDGNVVLSTGIRLRAVEVIPVGLPYELSDLEWRILRCTIKCMRIEDRVVRTLGEELPPEVQATLPVIRRIDFQRLRGFKIPALKVLQDFIVNEVIERVSPEKISSTLAKCGMRPVVRRRSPPATRSGLI